MGRPQKNNLFTNTTSFRLSIIKIISGITNNTIAVVLNAFSMPEIKFFVMRNKMVHLSLNFAGP